MGGFHAGDDGIAAAVADLARALDIHLLVESLVGVALDRLPVAGGTVGLLPGVVHGLSPIPAAIGIVRLPFPLFAGLVLRCVSLPAAQIGGR